MEKLPAIKRDVVLNDETALFIDAVQRYGASLRDNLEVQMLTEQEVLSMQNIVTQKPQGVDGFMRTVEEREGFILNPTVVDLRIRQKSGKRQVDVLIARDGLLQDEREFVLHALKREFAAEKLPKATQHFKPMARVGTKRRSFGELDSEVKRSLLTVMPRRLELGPLRFK